jgi:hypothetical protein
MQLRRAHETTVSMVPTPRPYATAPHAPADRAQPLSQTLHRPSRPLPQQASKIAHPDDGMWEEQTSAPHHGVSFRDLAAPFVPLSGKGQLADLQKQNAALTKELGKAIAGQTPKSDNATTQNTVADNSVVNSHAVLLVRSDSHDAFSVPNDIQAKENAAIAEIRKTLLERKRQHDSSANITCNYSPFIPPTRMTQIIAETAEKLDMSSVTNVDTVTVFFQRGTTPHTTKAIAPLSGHVTVKVMKCEAEKTKVPTSTPARPLPEPIEQREATYNKAR